MSQYVLTYTHTGDKYPGHSYEVPLPFDPNEKEIWDYLILHPTHTICIPDEFIGRVWKVEYRVMMREAMEEHNRKVANE